MQENHDDTDLCQIERRTGEACGRTVSVHLSVQVCDHHATMIYREMVPIIQAAYFAQEHLHQTRRKVNAKKHAARVKSRDGWVYYIAMPGDLIKIGFSAAVGQRVSGLGAQLTDLIALEPGGFEVEQQRHAQFGHLRWRPRSERFRDTPELRQHIATVLAEHGRPLLRDRYKEPEFVID